MRFDYTYKITYASGQSYDRWKSHLFIEVTEEQHRKIIENLIQGNTLSESVGIDEVLQEMERDVRYIDRWNNLDGTSRTTPLKKERDIARIELRIPEDEERRIRKMKNPLKTLTQPINQLEIPRNSDGSSVIISTEQGRVRIKDSRKSGTEVLTDADQFLDMIVRW